MSQMKIMLLLSQTECVCACDAFMLLLLRDTSGENVPAYESSWDSIVCERERVHEKNQTETIKYKAYVLIRLDCYDL